MRRHNTSNHPQSLLFFGRITALLWGTIMQRGTKKTATGALGQNGASFLFGMSLFDVRSML